MNERARAPSKQCEHRSKRPEVLNIERGQRIIPFFCLHSTQLLAVLKIRATGPNGGRSKVRADSRDPPSVQLTHKRARVHLDDDIAKLVRLRPRSQSCIELSPYFFAFLLLQVILL